MTFGTEGILGAKPLVREEEMGLVWGVSPRPPQEGALPPPGSPKSRILGSLLALVVWALGTPRENGDRAELTGQMTNP